MPPQMTLRLSLPLHWLACCVLVCLMAAAARAEVRVIDRQPVAGGAEVVLELVSDDGPATYYQYSYRAPDGTAQAFYRMVVQMKKADGSVGYRKQWIASRIDELKFDDHRVSLFHPDLYDCVVVTLELDPAAPKVHVDRFLSSYGFGSVHAELVGVDELVLSDPSEQRLPVKKLKRAADGSWRLAGIPYEKDVSSDVMTVPLPSVSKMLKQEAQSAVKRVAEGEGWTSLQAVSAQAATQEPLLTPQAAERLQTRKRSEPPSRAEQMARAALGYWVPAGASDSVSPLRSRQELGTLLAQQRVQQAEAAEAREAASGHVPPLSAVSMRDPITTTPDTDLRGWLRVSDIDDRAQSIAKLERVRALPGLFSLLRLKAAPAPTLVVGRETPLPPLFLSPECWADCGWVRMPAIRQSLMLEHFLRRLDSSRPTLSELPCYDNDYDQAVNDLSAAYGCCQEYFATRLAKSMHGVDDVAFLDLIEWEMKKGEG